MFFRRKPQMEIMLRGAYRVINLIDGSKIGDAVRIINSGRANGINFNFIKNFPRSIEEIRMAPDTLELQINDYDHKQEYDYQAIHDLSNLEHLSVYTTDRKEIDFGKFPALKGAAFYWRPRAKSLYACTQLEKLFLGMYTEHDLTQLGSLTNLMYLRINTGSVRRLEGIEKFQKLTTLQLMQATKLEDLAGIEKLPHLKEVVVDNCRNIENIQLLGDLKQRTTVRIRGTTPRLG